MARAAAVPRRVGAADRAQLEPGAAPRRRRAPLARVGAADDRSADGPGEWQDGAARVAVATDASERGDHGGGAAAAHRERRPVEGTHARIRPPRLLLPDEPAPPTADARTERVARAALARAAHAVTAARVRGRRGGGGRVVARQPAEDRLRSPRRSPHPPARWRSSRPHARTDAAAALAAGARSARGR